MTNSSAATAANFDPTSTSNAATIINSAHRHLQCCVGEGAGHAGGVGCVEVDLAYARKGYLAERTSEI
jgi:hypothetical protein